MRSSRLLSGALLCALLLLSSVAGAEEFDTESEEELSPRALRDFYPKGPNLTSEKQLVSFTSALLPLCMRATARCNFKSVRNNLKARKKKKIFYGIKS